MVFTMSSWIMALLSTTPLNLWADLSIVKANLPFWQILMCDKCGLNMGHMTCSIWINNLIIMYGIGLGLQCYSVKHLFFIGVVNMQYLPKNFNNFFKCDFFATIKTFLRRQVWIFSSIVKIGVWKGTPLLIISRFDKLLALKFWIKRGPLINKPRHNFKCKG